MKKENTGIQIVSERDLIKLQETKYTSISSSCLFHFVKNKSHLLDILRDGFHARYSVEKHPYNGTWLAIPMKCFCDIPLHMAKKHMINYGKYGIGISKMNAIENHITPVIYSNPSSQSLLSFQPKFPMDPSIEIIEYGDTALPYFKVYEGYYFTRKTKRMKYIRYYDEREWRYVPRNPNPKIYNFHHIPKDDWKNRLKELSESLYVRHAPDISISSLIISYIIVEKNEDVKWIIDKIKCLKEFETYHDLLISKIITKTQIWCDF